MAHSPRADRAWGSSRLTIFRLPVALWVGFQGGLARRRPHPNRARAPVVQPPARRAAPPAARAASTAEWWHVPLRGADRAQHPRACQNQRAVVGLWQKLRTSDQTYLAWRRRRDNRRSDLTVGLVFAVFCVLLGLAAGSPVFGLINGVVVAGVTVWAVQRNSGHGGHRS